MRIDCRAGAAACDLDREDRSFPAVLPVRSWLILALLVAIGIGSRAQAQVNVVTKHNDIARTGQNLQETLLTPASVTGGFGKLFSQSVTGVIMAQPLYVSQVTIPGKGVHNVVYVVTESDYVYAFDADSNGGVDATPLWQVWLQTNTSPLGTYNAHFGVYGTPVIDPSTNTMYLVSSETQISTSTLVDRLHALDITTGAEKFGGPVLIQASVPGTGTGSSANTLAFNPEYELQRPGLLLVNGVLYIGFGGIGDAGPWHGWLFSYNAANLKQIDVLSTSSNGSGSGIWMGGAGLAAEVNNPAKPYGRMFVATGNGTFAVSQPYDETMSYAMSVVDLDLTGGHMTVEDEFTPYNWSKLNGQDADLGSGGPLLLPTQTMASGKTLNPLVQIGKSGMIYILDRDNNNDGSNNPATEYSPAGLGGFNAAGDQVVQEVQTPITGTWGEGVWGSTAYWNNNIYFGGINPNANSGLTAYSFVNGVLSTTPTSQTVEQFSYPGPIPSVSANGTTNPIVWVINHGTADNFAAAALQAFDATNLANLLYSSNTDLSRDNPGTYVEYSVPTIANGKVYVNTAGQLSAFGLLGSTPTVAPPVISPSGGTFTGSQSVTITDTTPGAVIYYTTDGSTPTVSSKKYTAAFTITSSETITAIASATGFLQGAPVSAIFSSTANAANPTFSPAAGSYTGAQKVTISDSSPGTTIYYTTDGTTPTTASSVYTSGQPIRVAVDETLQAMATTPSLLPSSVVSASYTINPAYVIDFSQGFANALTNNQMQFNGSTDLDDVRLQLTNGGTDEAGSAFFTTPVSITSFTTDFTFQLSNPAGDGMTFTIQNTGPKALGVDAAGLGFGGIGSKSVAIKFDFYNNAGQGNDSTGIYIGGVSPTVPSIDLTNTGINLRSDDYMNVHMTYDGKVLNMTITDTITLASWSTSFPISIPYHVGGNTAYVGFTAGTGSNSSSQKITAWTYLPGVPALPNYPVGFDAGGMVLNGGAALSGTNLQLTGGSPNVATSAYYTAPVDIDSFTTDFDFTIAPGSTSTLADGFTFVMQDASLSALGSGSGGLGYATIPNSVAIKFDVFNNAGEGANSTGVYVNGASPTVPSINLTATGLAINTGHTIHMHITYDGTTLTWAFHDLVHQDSASESLKINIPHTIGSNTAYVGFTAASGDGTAIQQISDWTFTNP